MKAPRAGGHQQDEGERVADPTEGRIDVPKLFREHARFVASFLRRLGTPSGDIDDLVQEVFLIAHRKGGFVPGTGGPRSWLGAIALRVASTSKRSRGRRREDPLEDADLDLLTTPGQAASVEARQLLGRVQQALETLDLEHRAAFVLYEIEGEACESIAASLGIPLGTVYSRLHNGRRRFLTAFAALDSIKTAAVARRVAGGT
jgi:RNA polymerase sigma-70 factor (ECF subfamily)